MIILESLHPVALLGIIVGVFAVIAIIAFIIYRRLHPKLKDEEEEHDFVQEELDRVLVPVEDEEVAKAINDYKEEDD